MLSSGQYAAAAVAIGVPFLLQLYWRYRRLVKDVNLSTRSALIDSANLMTGLFPGMKWLNMGHDWYYREGNSVFAKAGADVTAVFGFVPSMRANLDVADAAVIKEITTARSKFPKNLAIYEHLRLYGNNVISTEGHEWKRHRRVTAPAFSERAMKLVWDESVIIMQGLFEIWGDRRAITTDHAKDITLPMTLMVIASAGFGKRLSWKEDTIVPEGHLMTFKHALHIVSGGIFTQLFIPPWLKGWKKEWREIRTAFDELGLYMREMIRDRQKHDAKQGEDLLTSLLEASEMAESEETGGKLTDEEVMGNIFIFLLAGHETSAHTLCFAFAFLALYPQYQEQLYEEVMSKIKDINKPQYSEMNSVPFALAVIYETMRHIPPVGAVPKVITEDTILRIPQHDGSVIASHCPKGTTVNINIMGLSMNPRYWTEPERYDPNRFLGDWNRDAFIPFSAGPRACLGRKFAETESVAILSMLVSKYRISIKPELQFAHETFDQRKTRVLRMFQGITLTPVRVPIVFSRR